jgi:hypothetical protein
LIALISNAHSGVQVSAVGYQASNRLIRTDSLLPEIRPRWSFLIPDHRCPIPESSFAGLVVLARGLNPIPSRTRPLNSFAPMVLSLKAWKSRSLPGLPRTIASPHHDDCFAISRPSGRLICLRGSPVPDPATGPVHLWSCPPHMKKAVAGNRGGFFCAINAP